MIKTSFSSRITAFFSMSSFAASNLAWMTPAALEETAFTALEAKTKASEQRASDEGTATQGLRVKLEGMEADRDKCKAEMEKLTAELEKVAAEKDAAVAHQKELQDALDAANKQLKKEAIVIASKDEFIKTLIQTPAAA